MKSPLKGNLSRIEGVITKPLKGHTIVIRTEDGKEHAYEARPLIQDRLAQLSQGQSATLLVDADQKVTDVSVIQGEKAEKKANRRPDEASEIVKHLQRYIVA